MHALLWKFAYKHICCNFIMLLLCYYSAVLNFFDRITLYSTFIPCHSVRGFTKSYFIPYLLTSSIQMRVCTITHLQRVNNDIKLIYKE